MQNEQTQRGVRIRFQRIDNQSGLKDREADYRMITFSSIKASGELNRIYVVNDNTELSKGYT
ncbi:hypothetical protein TUM12370_20410 [Salmonella enterica subsp. enterica serovar Choleraesuis]|nr:hypothetical protein TUM12370_20410 [Salmonella enterica subsp. enterica serovar Choleraesuis]